VSVAAPASELERLGFTPFFGQQVLLRLADGNDLVPARIVCERRGEYDVATATHVCRAMLRGRLVHELGSEERPTTGDWVLVEPADPVARIHEVLERQSVLRRVGVDGSSRSQTLAANVDVCFVVCALPPAGADRHVTARTLNARRIERYLSIAHESRLPAVIVVNKADLADDPQRLVDAHLGELGAVELLLVSAASGRGLEDLRSRLLPNVTGVLLGPSGVGKSTLTNALLERTALRTAGIRDDDARGRHTTTERHLELVPGGGMLIDTPGMRELAPWADAATERDGSGFAEIDALAQRCRFADCSHRDEPGCAVRAALEAGTVSAERVEHARKLERERLHQLARNDGRLREEAKKRSRALSRAVRAYVKSKRGDD
jgi:ribosome biogenesis GTPase